jgi:hypothetical protein
MPFSENKWYDVFAVFLVGVILSLSMLILVSRVLADTKIDTTPISNIGFAVLAAIASLCFNWAKTFDNNDKKEIEIIKKLNRAGAKSIFASICFMSASLSKYVFIKYDKFKEALPFALDFFKFLFGIGFLIAFLTADLLVLSIVGRIGICYLHTVKIDKNDPIS